MPFLQTVFESPYRQATEVNTGDFSNSGDIQPAAGSGHRCIQTSSTVNVDPGKNMKTIISFLHSYFVATTNQYSFIHRKCWLWTPDNSFVINEVFSFPWIQLHFPSLAVWRSKYLSFWATHCSHHNTDSRDLSSTAAKLLHSARALAKW